MFYTEMRCRIGNTMSLNGFSRDGLMWQCTTPSCQCANGLTRQRRSVRTGSFFFGRRTPIHKVLLVVYFFLLGLTNKQISQGVGISPRTAKSIVDDAHALMVEDLRHEDTQIGKAK